MRYLITVLVLFIIVDSAASQQHKEIIKREVNFPDDEGTILVENIFGSVELEGYDGNKVILEVEKEFSADTKNELEDALRKVFLVIETKGDTVDVFLTGICGCNRNKNHNHNWHLCDFKFNYDFKVKVPRKANINVSTVNNGNVEVQNIEGDVVAKNVNGGITVGNISGSAKVHTINGNVEVRHVKNPLKKSSYYSLNGDVNVYYNPDLSAEMHFKSFQGEMYSDFDNTEMLPPVLTTSKTKNKNNTTYKIDNVMAIKVGKGGIVLSFETFNGDVYVRKI
jgi:hypothetical protein